MNILPRMVPLGDQAILVQCKAEEDALTFADSVRAMKFPWCGDVVQAYTTVGVYYDLRAIRFQEVSEALRNLPVEVGMARSGKHCLHTIPCCYDYQLDRDRICDYKGLSWQEIITEHTSREYTVYAIGFCPGFPYLGYLPEVLSGVPRLPTPRLKLELGSVGLTGRQTGIYTLPRPGGWNIIGRTPLELVHVGDEYFPIRTGDKVRFQAIDKREFEKLKGERL